MCRIVGILDKKQNYNKIRVLNAMRDTMAHGGPDAANSFCENEIAMGHRRLSILDLSEAGNQPMFWEEWVIVYNGEIYNFQEIRSDLEAIGHDFITETDTEIIIKAYISWGYDCVKKFHGMFAFALWNRKEKRLILCRDRLGVKPLFYFSNENTFLFASELKALMQHPNFNKELDKNAISLFLQQGYINAPNTIFQYVKKIEPGSFLTIDANFKITRNQYYSPEKLLQQSPFKPEKEEKLTEELEEILKRSFLLRMVSDVPVGMFLSGGIDSSLVTALIQKESNQQLKTFTIGFNDPKFNEATFAKKVSQHIGTDHTEIYCTEDDFKDIIPKYFDIYDEPFGDSSGIPTYLVSKLAKEQVKVSLSADGGDEIFGGYSKYHVIKDLHPKLKKIPTSIKNLSAQLAHQIDPLTVEKFGSKLPYFRNFTNLGVKYYKMRDVLSKDSVIEQFNASSTYYSKSELKEIYPVFASRFKENLDFKANRLISYLGYIDLKTYLEGDILTKVDRATMKVSLEGREPFLDQDLVSFGLRLPDALKYKNGKGKHLLRKILYKYVPKDLIERPKQGFAVPIKDWLRGILKDELIQITFDDEFFTTFDLNQIGVTKKINFFLEKTKYENEYNIWFIYVLYKWYTRWLKN